MAEPDYHCSIYGAEGGPGLEEIPDDYWRKIELAYPDGRLCVLVYADPPAESELRQLMWVVQHAATKADYHVTMVKANGERFECDRLLRREGAIVIARVG